MKPIVAALIFSLSFCCSLFFHIEKPAPVVVPPPPPPQHHVKEYDCYHNVCYPEAT